MISGGEILRAIDDWWSFGWRSLVGEFVGRSLFDGVLVAIAVVELRGRSLVGGVVIGDR